MFQRNAWPIAIMTILSLSCIASAPAGAQVFIPASASVGEVPTEAGTGLNGFYYRHPDGCQLRFLTDAIDYINSQQVSGTFTATTLNYYSVGTEDGGSDGSVATVLGMDTPSYVGVDPTIQAASVWHFTGSIAITPEMDIDPISGGIDVRFGIASDDASLLRIGGVSVVRAAKLNLGEFEPMTERGVYDASEYQSVASFATPGLYPVEIAWFDWYGGIGLNVFSSIGGGLIPEYGSPPGFEGILPTSILYGGPDISFAGDSQDNPALPTRTDEGTLFFDNVETDLWFDPIATGGYSFSALGGSRFTRIINFPAGFASPFTVSVGSTVLGQFAPGQSVDFNAFTAGGVSSFTITGINPLVDGSDPTAFPIQLAFDTQTASFTMTPLGNAAAAPEPGTFSLILGGGILCVIGTAWQRRFKRSRRTWISPLVWMTFGMTLLALCLTPLPCRAYDDDTHFLLTYLLAREAGYTQEQALRVARACIGVDNASETEPVQKSLTLKNLRLASAIRTRLHAFRDGYVFDDPEKADKGVIAQRDVLREQALGLENPGIFLHAFEDSFAHAGYWSEFGHWNPLDWNQGHDVDILSYNPDKSRRMAKKTVIELQQFLLDKGYGSVVKVSQERIDILVNLLIEANPNPSLPLNYRSANELIKEKLGYIENIPSKSDFDLLRGFGTKRVDSNLTAYPQSSQTQRFSLWTNLSVQLIQTPNKAGITYGNVDCVVSLFDRWPNRDYDLFGYYKYQSLNLRPDLDTQFIPFFPVGKFRIKIRATRPDIANYVKYEIKDWTEDKLVTVQRTVDWGTFSFESTRRKLPVFGNIQATAQIKNKFPDGEFIASASVPYGNGTLKFTFGPTPDSSGSWRRARFTKYGWDGFACRGPVVFEYIPAKGSSEKRYSGGGTGKFNLNKAPDNSAKITFCVSGKYKRNKSDVFFEYTSQETSLPTSSVGGGPVPIIFHW